MEKFTSKDFKEVNNTKNKKGKLLYKNDYMGLIDYEGWTFVDEFDCIVVIPYLVERNEILIRQEYIPTFKYVENKEMYITCVSGQIEQGEQPNETLLRELQEECGIVLSPNVKINFEAPLFMNKGNVAKIYPCILYLSESDYYTVKITGDGSVSENKSSTIRVNLSSVKHLISSDVITSYMLSLLKD